MPGLYSPTDISAILKRAAESSITELISLMRRVIDELEELRDHYPDSPQKGEIIHQRLNVLHLLQGIGFSLYTDKWPDATPAKFQTKILGMEEGIGGQVGLFAEELFIRTKPSKLN